MLPRTRARAIGPDTEEYRCRGRALLGEEHCDQAAVPRADVGCGGLSDLRAAVLGELEAAPDLDALRTLLRGLFEAVHYVRAGADDPELLFAVGVGSLRPGLRTNEERVVKRPLALAVSDSPNETDV